MQIYLSKNFTLNSLTYTSYKNLQEENRLLGLHFISPLRALCEDILEPVSVIAGEAVTVTSAFRCAALNKILGGAALSQHCKAEAADFTCSKMPLEQLFKLLKQNFALLKYGQLILEVFPTKKWLHISLGYPYRMAQKCGQSFVLNNGKVENFIQHKLMD